MMRTIPILDIKIVSFEYGSHFLSPMMSSNPSSIPVPHPRWWNFPNFSPWLSHDYWWNFPILVSEKWCFQPPKIHQSAIEGTEASTFRQERQMMAQDTRFSWEETWEKLEETWKTLRCLHRKNWTLAGKMMVDGDCFDVLGPCTVI